MQAVAPTSPRELDSGNQQHHRQRSIGCMPGILRLLSPYHRFHHRKRLTSSSKNDKNTKPVTTPPLKPQPKPNSKLPVSESKEAKNKETHIRRRRSCETPRSPAISPELRRTSSAISGASPDSPRPPPAIVARLMGLEESAPTSPAMMTPALSPPESASDKRRKLLGALEKCDEDLKALRRIIAAVRASEMRQLGGQDARMERVKLMNGGDGEHPSPVSVLDVMDSPSLGAKRWPRFTNLDGEKKNRYVISAVGSGILKPSGMKVFSGDNYKKPWEDNRCHVISSPVLIKRIPRISRWKSEDVRREWQQGRSRAMVENVGEVWEEGRGGGQKWEIGRIGVALECAILSNLVEEIVIELFASKLSLPYTRSRKRLYF